MSLKKITLLINCIVAAQLIHANDLDLLRLNTHLDALAQPSGIYVTTADGAEIFFPQALIDSKSVASEFLTKATSQYLTTKTEGPTVDLLKQAMTIFKNASETTDKEIEKALWARFDNDIGSNSFENLQKLSALAAQWKVSQGLLHRISRLRKAAAPKPAKK